MLCVGDKVTIIEKDELKRYEDKYPAEEGHFYMGNGRWNVACSADPDKCPFYKNEEGRQ